MTTITAAAYAGITSAGFAKVVKTRETASEASLSLLRAEAARRDDAISSTISAGEVTMTAAWARHIRSRPRLEALNETALLCVLMAVMACGMVLVPLVIIVFFCKAIGPMGLALGISLASLILWLVRKGPLELVGDFRSHISSVREQSRLGYGLGFLNSAYSLASNVWAVGDAALYVTATNWSGSAQDASAVFYDAIGAVDVVKDVAGNDVLVIKGRDGSLVGAMVAPDDGRVTNAHVIAADIRGRAERARLTAN